MDGLSEKTNGVPLVCDSRTRKVSSVYKSAKASPFIQVGPGRSQSPIVNHKSDIQELKLLRRSQSAERRRPSNPSSASSRPSTPANDSMKEMHSTSRHLLVGRTSDGLWPSMKSLSLSFGTKNAVSERKTSDLSENARPVEDIHGRTMDQSRRLGLRSRKGSADSSKSNSLITPSMGVSDKGYKQMRSEVERRRSLDSNGMSKPSRKNSSPLPRSHHALPSIKTLSAPCPTSKEISGPNGRKNGVCSTPSVLNYTVLQVRKGKQSTKRIKDAHQLRMLHNRYLQWRFVNAFAEDVLSVQRIKAVTTLYDMENVSSELCDPFIQKRIYMQHMKKDMKLKMLLKEHITYLEDWGTIENEHCFSLSGTIRALKASTLWIPVTGGARVDIKAMKNAINSAVDVMQAMGSSICHLSSKVDQVSSLISDLLASARKERSMLDECAELLAFAGKLQVQDTSLRGHIIQLGQFL